MQPLAYEEVYMESGIGETIELPEEIGVCYNDPSVSGTMKVEWSEEDLAAIDFDVYQSVTVPADGMYTARANVQGGDMGPDQKVCVFVKNGDEEFVSEPVALDGWRSWKKITLPDLSMKAGDEIIVGISVQGAAKGWGTIDDVELYK